MADIVVFSPLETDFSGNGVAVLCPLSVTHKSIAGGAYTFEMEHPLDPWGKWEHLVEEAIVRLPVPKEEIANAFAGQDADVYVTTTAAELLAGTSEPTNITYSEWNAGALYEVGDKVTCTGASHRNYKCIYFDQNSGQVNIPPYTSSWWSAIPDKTSGSAVLSTLPQGTELYLVEDVDATWYKLSTYYGLEGYVKKSKVTFLEHRSASEMHDRVITDQLFRIKTVNVNKKSRKVNASGVHVSSDLNGIQVRDVSITQGAPAMAITRVVDNLLWGYAGTIGTNLTSGTQTYTGSFKGKNGTYCLLDPDSGIVPTFDAKFTRDNWDLFILSRDDTYTGYEIRYGKNVDGIDWKYNSEGLITRVMPVAKDAKGNDLYLPEVYVDSSDIADYPVIYMETLKVSGQVGKAKDDAETETWTEADLLTEMRTKAGERFSVDLVDQPTTEVTVQLVPLEGSAEYAWLSDISGVLLYDRVKITDTETGRTAQLLVSELEYDCIKRRVVGLKLTSSLNSVTRSVTGYSITNASIGAEKLKDDVAEDIVNAAVSKMPEFSDPTAVGVTVTDGNPTLAWSTRSTVGTVNGTDLHVTMPSDPSVTVVDNLTSTSTTSALSANQGRVLDNIKADKTDTVLNTTLSRGRKANTLVGTRSFAFGEDVTAIGEDSAAFGYNTMARGDCSVAIGAQTTAYGTQSFAEGGSTIAGGFMSHAEGDTTESGGEASHSEGKGTIAGGYASHSEGVGTLASSYGQHVSGKYNVEDSNNTYAEIVGRGSDNGHRDNAHTLDWSGNAEYAGDVSAYDCGGAQPVSIGGLVTATAYRATYGTAPTGLTKGQYVWINNALHRATTSIASGAAVSTSTNVTTVTGGGLNDHLAQYHASRTWGDLLSLYTWGQLVGQ